MTNVLIVDDDPDVRLLLRVLISMERDLHLVAEAVDGIDAFSQWEALDPKPAVVLTDNQMPRSGGLDLARRILAECPEQVVILFSAFLDDGLRQRAAAIGVTHCVGKEQLVELPTLLRAATAATVNAASVELDPVDG